MTKFLSDLTGEETAKDLARMYINDEIGVATLIFAMGYIQRKEGKRQ